MANLVLIDTCIWGPFFSRKASAHKTAVRKLLKEDRAAIVGPILAETLLGFKKTEEADWVASALEGSRYFDLAWDDWCAAANLGRQLAAGGHDLPLSDLCLAAVAKRIQCQVYTIDPHFDVIPDLQRFAPD